MDFIASVLSLLIQHFRCSCSVTCRIRFEQVLPKLITCLSPKLLCRAILCMFCYPCLCRPQNFLAQPFSMSTSRSGNHKVGCILQNGTIKSYLLIHRHQLQLHEFFNGKNVQSGSSTIVFEKNQ